MILQRVIAVKFIYPHGSFCRNQPAIHFMTDRYQIIRLITKDQLGGVYLAEDTQLGRKIVFRHFDRGYDSPPDDNWKHEFSQYAAKLQALQHPNLIALYDASTDNEDAIVISQFLEGEKISHCIKTGPLEVIEMVNMAIDLLTAMQVCHSIGIYHGAMHTGSVQRQALPHGGHHYLIIDLGLKRLSSIVTGEEVNLEDPILIPAELYGKSHAANAQSDLFMVGQLCYTALAGGHPFAEYSAEQCSKAYRAGKTPPLRKFNDEVQTNLTSWITSMIASHPKQRPASAEEALKSLQSITLKAPKEKKSSAPTQEAPTKNLTPEEENAPQSKKKSKTGLILGIILLLAIAAGVFFRFPSKQNDAHSTTQPKSEKNNPSAEEKINPPPPQSTKKTTAPIDDGPNAPQIIRATKITPTNSMTRSKKVTVKSLKYFDWAIPLEKGPNNKLGLPYKLDLSWEGELLGTPFNRHLIQFNIKGKKKGRTITPIAAQTITSPTNRPQRWDINFRAPGSHKGALEAILYITQQSCSLSFDITLPTKKHVILKSQSKGPGVIEVHLLFPEITPSKLYNIQVTATPITSEPPAIAITGLHGVFLQKPASKAPPIAIKPNPPKPKKKPTHKKAKVKQKSAKKKSTPESSTGFKPTLQPFNTNNHFNSSKWHHAEASIIKVGEGKYCLYYSRWPKTFPVNARISHPEIAIAISNSSSGPWKYWKTILKGRNKNWDQFGVSHPIIKQFDGEYYLYYVSTSADLTKQQVNIAVNNGTQNKNWQLLNNNRCIGVAHAISFKGPWKRLDKPIITAQPPFFGFSCSPSVTKSPDGEYLIMVCSQSNKGKTVSYIAKSKKPYFSNPITQAIIPQETFSFLYQPSNKTYQIIFNGEANHFFFLHSSNLKNWYQRNLAKPSELPPNSPVKTSSFKSPHLFLGDDQQPEVFIFHSEDVKNGGIFTIPFKK